MARWLWLLWWTLFLSAFPFPAVVWPSVLSQGHPEQISSSSTTSVNPVVYCAYVLVEDGVYEVCDLDAELVMRTVKIMEGVK